MKVGDVFYRFSVDLSNGKMAKDEFEVTKVYNRGISAKCLTKKALFLHNGLTTDEGQLLSNITHRGSCRYVYLKENDPAEAIRRVEEVLLDQMEKKEAELSELCDTACRLSKLKASFEKHKASTEGPKG